MIPEQRIRELAAYASDPCADVQHYLAAELLAARETIERVTKERDSEAREAAGYQKIAKEAVDANEPGLLVLLVDQQGSEVRIFGPDRDAEERFGEMVARWWKLLQVTSECIELEDRTKERDAAIAENERLAKQLGELVAGIEEAHNGYHDDGRELGVARPASHLIALNELLAEQCDIAALMARHEAEQPKPAGGGA